MAKPTSFVPIPVALRGDVSGICGYSDAEHDRKAAFHAGGKKFLRALAKELGLAPADYALRSNKAGPAVAGEITLHADDIYLEISTALFIREASLLYRDCKSRQDYSGGHNNFANFKNLGEPEAQARVVSTLRTMLARAAVAHTNAAIETAADTPAGADATPLRPRLR